MTGYLNFSTELKDFYLSVNLLNEGDQLMPSYLSELDISFYTIDRLN